MIVVIIVTIKSINRIFVLINIIITITTQTNLRDRVERQYRLKHCLWSWSWLNSLFWSNVRKRYFLSSSKGQLRGAVIHRVIERGGTTVLVEKSFSGKISEWTQKLYFLWRKGFFWWRNCTICLKKKLKYNMWTSLYVRDVSGGVNF